MELRHLRYFVTIFELGSFSRAAEHLNLTQSALTHSVKALEKSIGIALLERGAGGATPTRAGKALYEHAKLLISDSDRIRTEVQRAAAGLASTIKLGASPLFAETCLPQALARFAGTYERVSIHVQEGDVEDMVAALTSGQIDLVISTVPIAPMQTNLAYERLGSVRWNIFATPDHELAANAVVTASELRRHRWALLERQHEMDFLARYFAAQDEGLPEDGVLTGSMALMRSLVVGHGMIGLLPAPYMTGTAAVPLHSIPAHITRPFGLIRRGDSVVSRTMQEFIAIFKASLPPEIIERPDN